MVDNGFVTNGVRMSATTKVAAETFLTLTLFDERMRHLALLLEVASAIEERVNDADGQDKHGEMVCVRCGTGRGQHSLYCRIQQALKMAGVK